MGNRYFSTDIQKVARLPRKPPLSELLARLERVGDVSAIHNCTAIVECAPYFSLNVDLHELTLDVREEEWGTVYLRWYFGSTSARSGSPPTDRIYAGMELQSCAYRVEVPVFNIEHGKCLVYWTRDRERALKAKEIVKKLDPVIYDLSVCLGEEKDE